MEKYVFSGSLTKEMKEMLAAMKDFEPLDMLVSQVDRNAVRQVLDWKKEGFCRWFMLDSGAYSWHTGKWRGTVDSYIDYINSVADEIDVCAQLDTIPGTYRQPKKPEDYIESAEKSWENFLYMRERVVCPEKLMPVSHMGESMESLTRMLEWRDENGRMLDYVGISPSNDLSTEERVIYLENVFDHIKKSKNPNVKTHVYGFTSLKAMAKFPCYSADSVTHRILSGYAKVLSERFGIVSVSDRDRTSKAKSNRSFLQGADEFNLSKLDAEAKSMGLTLDDLQNNVSARVVFNVINTQRMIKGKYAYHPSNHVRMKKLF